MFVALGLTLACAEESAELCVGAICPAGSTCNATTGQCEPEEPPTAVVGALAHYVSAAATQTGDTLVLAAYDTDFDALVVRRIGMDGVPKSVVRVDGGVPGAPDVGQYASLALDRDDLAHVAYYDATSRDLRVAREAADGGWTVQTVDGDGGQVGRWASAVVDNLAAVHVAYRDDDAKTLRMLSLADYGCRPADAAEGEAVPLHITGAMMAAAGMPSSDFGAYASLGITGDGALVVSFYDAERGNLVLARCNGHSVSLQILDGEDPDTGMDTGDVGRWSSLAVDPDGDAAVAYYDRTRGVLKYAGSRQGQIEITVVDDGSGCGVPAGHDLVGQRASLAVRAGADGAAGLPRIAYVDATARAVRLARRTEFGVWGCETVGESDPSATVGGVGLGLDLVVSATDAVHVVYGEWQVGASGQLATSLVTAVVGAEEEVPADAP